MKCSTCGTEIPEGSLYCEKCGGDVHIVPDFEPELDFNLSESISNLAAEVKVEEKDAEDAAGVERHHREKNRKLTVRSVFLLCVCTVLTVILLGFVLRISQHYSYSYQLKKAAACFQKSDYQTAESCYRRALELDDSDISVYFALADTCLQKGNKIEYEYLLRNIIRNPSCSREQLEYAYGKLIGIYREREEYDIINEILSVCENDKIKNAYQVYLASPPEFNYEAGKYQRSIPLKLTSPTTGSIYYTVDGTEPDENSILYTSPVLLNEDVVIKAIVVNQFGVSSTVVSKEYLIQMPLEEAPVVGTVSGTYHVPTWIEVQVISGKEIYYTTDGTAPTIQSRRYTGPIPMPMGESTYNFAYITEDGTCGEITGRNYKLELQAEITVAEAESLVVEYMLILKKIFKEDGTFRDDTSARYLYQYQYVVHIDERGDFYVVAEIYKDESNVLSKTGSYYAVNIHNKECYKFLQDENSNYSLVDIIINSLE